jgi:hypothetical protein
MSAEDKNVLMAIKSALKVAGKNCGSMRDADDPTVMELVLKSMPHLSSEWLRKRIREFQNMVNDHVVKSAIHIIIRNLV